MLNSIQFLACNFSSIWGIFSCILDILLWLLLLNILDLVQIKLIKCRLCSTQDHATFDEHSQACTCTPVDLQESLPTSKHLTTNNIVFPYRHYTLCVHHDWWTCGIHVIKYDQPNARSDYSFTKLPGEYCNLESPHYTPLYTKCFAPIFKLILWLHSLFCWFKKKNVLYLVFNSKPHHGCNNLPLQILN